MRSSAEEDTPCREGPVDLRPDRIGGQRERHTAWKLHANPPTWHEAERAVAERQQTVAEAPVAG